jgi:hypothetical protein
MGLQTPDGTCVGENHDEYDKTILDYVVEFENIKMLKYMFEKKYVNVMPYGSYINTRICIGNHCSFNDMFIKIIKLAVKYDDLELFSQIVSREVPLWKVADNEKALYARKEYQDGFELDEELLTDILNTKNIFNYLVSPYNISSDSWNFLNRGIFYGDKNSKEHINNSLMNIQRLPNAFNLLMDIAINTENMSKIQIMSEIAQEHKIVVDRALSQFYDKTEITVDAFGNVKNGRWGSLSMVAVVQKELFDTIDNDKLKELTKDYVRCANANE